MKNRIEDNMNLVHKLAWKFHRTSGMDVVDLVSEGYVALVIADQSFDDSRSTKFSNYAYLAIQNRLINLVKIDTKVGFYEMGIPVDEEGEEMEIPDPNHMDTERTVQFRRGLQSLSNIAQRACGLVISGLGFSKRDIKDKLVSEGYRKSEINRAFLEISEALR